MFCWSKAQSRAASSWKLSSKEPHACGLALQLSTAGADKAALFTSRPMYQGNMGRCGHWAGLLVPVVQL